MGRIVALWKSNWLGKAIIIAVGLLLLSCVFGALGRGRTPQQAAAPAGQPQAPAAPAPTEPPAPTDAPQPTQTPVPTITPDASIDHSGVAPLNKDDCPPRYLIKANEGSKLYHLPGDRGYAQTDPERCFATADDAKAAGYSAAPSN